ncbi:DoxX family protein [Ornithinimicrobium avium]|uniref:DoxX family protein n=1 Tax=Ornithinimicrobium avium TaxID=2283195 RepID=A0A345NJP4_9MICO|nr:DoxX family protein [Ornithinimicrobium avium]AXH95252.1 DoxX family protein [Ornithinimicrobium avium]
MSEVDGREDEPRTDYHRDVYDEWGDPDPGELEAHSHGLDFGLLLLRLGSLPLVAHGLHGAADMPGLIRRVGDHPLGAQSPEFFAWILMLAQVALPVLLAVGLFTRPAAFFTAAMTAVLWLLTVPLSLGYSPLTPQGALTGEALLLHVGLSLPLVFTGAGRWSLDAMRTAGRP